MLTTASPQQRQIKNQVNNFPDNEAWYVGCRPIQNEPQGQSGYINRREMLANIIYLKYGNTCNAKLQNWKLWAKERGLTSISPHQDEEIRNNRMQRTWLKHAFCWVTLKHDGTDGTIFLTRQTGQVLNYQAARLRTCPVCPVCLARQTGQMGQTRQFF